jgi:hypothetical protein
MLTRRFLTITAAAAAFALALAATAEAQLGQDEPPPPPPPPPPPKKQKVKVQGEVVSSPKGNIWKQAPQSSKPALSNRPAASRQKQR